MKPAEMRERDDQGLRVLETELAENIFALKMQKHTGQLENVARLSATRRDLARVKTIVRARERGKEQQLTAASVKEAATETRPVASKKKATKKKAAAKKTAAKKTTTTKKKAATKKATTKKKAAKKKASKKKKS